jgi:hypothetical protein
MSAGSYGFYDLSTNLSDYILSFDARVEGLSPGQTSGNCEMQAQWQASGNVYQLNFGVAVPSNWTHYSMLLSEYSGTGGTPGSLSNWVWLVENYMISGMTWNVNLHQPDPQFGFDDNNAVFVDNLTLQMIVRTGAPPVLPPTVALNILDWNMDDKPVWGGWGAYSWSQNAAYTPTFTWSPTANTYGVGGSNGWYLQMDNTVLAPPNTPSWAGGGCGDNGPTDYSRFNSGDLAGYRLTFDARAEGLNPNKMDETGGALQLFLDAPGGNYRADFRIPAGSNWVTTSYILNQGSFNTDGGRLPKTSFPTNYNITAVRIQVQIENATSEGDWSYDADNLLVVDNIKLERMQIACPPLTITTIGSNEVLTWAQPYAGVAKLQAANGITGSWADVAGATSPYTNSVANAPKYYRTIWVAPTP